MVGYGAKLVKKSENKKKTEKKTKKPANLGGLNS
jgi:hypothetical protein